MNGNLLEITGNDIELLNDSDLRSLIGLLCEADYRLAGLSTSGITWSGHQDAPDGGLDVVVRSTVLPPNSTYIPRVMTGFQVKKPNMITSEIIKEMKPKGKIRESIKEIACESGAYIIASSGSSTTESELRKRVGSMRDIASEEMLEHIFVDFYDRGRIASWVRTHPSMILWVRNRIGRSLHGWFPYENWSRCLGGVEEDYLADNELRLSDYKLHKGEDVSILNGLEILRSCLLTPGSSTRLVGLSGVGKTRLVQAMFDKRVGSQALNQNLVIYSDTSDEPEPKPVNFLFQLLSKRKRVFLIVDNCSSKLHRSLSRHISENPDKLVSLLTIEHDVREDIPEDTNVFKLEPASGQIIEKLIMQRYSDIGIIDARKIASFSGGNARIAIVLAQTLKKGETLSGFRDEELFIRLFWQGHDSDDDLLQSAQACSVVYSFQGVDATSDHSELKVIASIVEESVTHLFRDVAILRERDLVQCRNVWMAILPHSIANRLAKQAFNCIPKDQIVNAILSSGSERLIKSFTRRLSYLHDSQVAVEIAAGFLSNQGWIGEHVEQFSDFEMRVFKDLAPVSPENALSAIERASTGKTAKSYTSMENRHHFEIVRVLRHIAFDPDLFVRCVSIICRFALAEGNFEGSQSVKAILRTLFYIQYSGTYASLESRSGTISSLLRSTRDVERDLGMYLLGAALQTSSFEPFYDYDFGARPRDLGYWPSDRTEIATWYSKFINLCLEMIFSGDDMYQGARILLSKNLEGLLIDANMLDELEKPIRQVNEQSPWISGWIAIREILNEIIKRGGSDTFERIQNLEKNLHPVNLADYARVFVGASNAHSYDLSLVLDDCSDSGTSNDRVNDKTYLVGVEVADNLDVLETLLPEVIEIYNQRHFAFGQGIADGASDKTYVWNLICSHFAKANPNRRRIDILLGFLASSADTNPEFHSLVLDSLIEDDLLGNYFPSFQMTSRIDKLGVNRLLQYLDTADAKVELIKSLAYGRNHESIEDDDLARIVQKVISKNDGAYVALEILMMRLYGHRGRDPEWSEQLMLVARKALMSVSFFGKHENLHIDHSLATIAEISLDGIDGADAAEKVCEKIVIAILENGRISTYNISNFLNVIARIQPNVFLSSFLENGRYEHYRIRHIFNNYSEKVNKNPLSIIPDDKIIMWCKGKPIPRFLIIAGTVLTYQYSDELKKLVWRPIFYLLISESPDREVVLESIAQNLRPKMWSEPLSEVMRKRMPLYSELFHHNNEGIKDWAFQEHANLQIEIEKQKEWEHQHLRDNHGFE